MGNIDLSSADAGVLHYALLCSSIGCTPVVRGDVIPAQGESGERGAGMPAARERSAPACADALQAGIQKCPQFVPGIVKERHLWIPACAGMTDGEAGMTDETE